MIEEYKTFAEYLDLKNNPIRENYQEEFLDKIPDEIKKILEIDRLIKPQHLSQTACRELFIIIAKTVEPKFIIDESNTEIIDLLCLYLRSDKKFNEFNPDYSTMKGLMLMGSLGTGKTVLIKIISGVLSSFGNFDYSYNPGFKIIPSYRMSANFIKHGYEYFDNIILSDDNVMADNLGIDDLGAENKIMYYGTPINVVGELILRRYDKRQSQRKGVTICTTNLNGDGLKEFYGERVHDRLIEIVNPIILTGKSRRK